MQQKPSSGQDIRAVIAAKEQELRNINEYRLQTLEQSVGEKDEVIEEQQAKIDKLKEDFQFNLKLIADRDTELERYDAMFNNFKEVISSKDGEISELRIHAADSSEMAKQEALKAAEMDQFYKAKMVSPFIMFESSNSVACNQAELGAEVERARLASDEESRAIRNQVAEAARDMERQLSEKDAQILAREHEMAAGLEEVAQQQEAERMRVEEQLKEASRQREAQWKEREEELKAKVASSERDLATLKGISTAEKTRIEELMKLLEEARAEAKESSTQLRKAEWEKDDAK